MAWKLPAFQATFVSKNRRGMKCSSIWIFCCMFATSVHAQPGEWRITGRVFGEAGEFLSGATVIADETAQAVTDTFGMFDLQLSARPKTLTVRLVGYFPQRMRLDTVLFTGKTARVQFFLVSNAVSLPEVAISGKPVETIFQENFQTNLLDYVFAGKDLLLLVREGKKYFLRLANDAGRTLAEMRLPAAQFKLLHQSCTGDFHVVGETWAWEVALNGQKIDTLPRYPAAHFHEFVEPCVLIHNDFYFFRETGPFRQSVRYVFFDLNKQRHLLTYIRDQAAEEQLTRRYREILYAYMQTIPDVDRDDILTGKNPLADPAQALKPENLGKMAETNALVGAIGFFNVLVADSVYAPLFKIGELLCVFDHVNGFLLRFDLALGGDSSIPIGYHRAPGWRKEMILDVALDRVYGRFTGKNGGLVLKEIDIGSGKVSKEYAPEIAPYLAENFRMRNGYLYFIGQPEVNVPNRRLYKVNLFKFGK
jgi:hypothetical protein